MLQLLEFFLEEGYRITFGSTAKETEYAFDLEAQGISKINLLLNDSSFDAFIQDLNPDTVLFDRFLTEEQFGWRVVKNIPNALRILDTEDLHSLRQVREDAFSANAPFSTSLWIRADISKREMASIYRCDLSLIISDYEMQWLIEKVKVDASLLLYLPFMLDLLTDKDQGEWIGFGERQDFITYGNGRHAPNMDAIHYLKTGIWPLIQKRMPQARLHIYGAYLPQSVKLWHNPKAGFFVAGWVRDLQSKVGQARVVLAPLRFGAGIKGKLVMAMQNGTPNVTTAIGAEGMPGQLPWSGAVAVNATDFAEKAVNLYEDEKKWAIAQENGTQIINTRYNKKSLTAKFSKVLESISKNRETHRQKNFIGQMLLHHTLASTRYMGKWIEEKNKRG